MQSSNTAPDTNGTNQPQSYNWESLIASLLATGGATLTIIWPGHSIPGTVQTAAVAVAGILVSLHVHVPKVVTHLFSTFRGVFSGSAPGGLTPAQTQLLQAAQEVLKEQKL